MLVGVVGTITTGKLANQLLEDGLDLAICGRMFQKNPGLVWAFAEELGVEIQMANQIRWGFGGRAGASKEKARKAKEREEHAQDQANGVEPGKGLRSNL